MVKTNKRPSELNQQTERAVRVQIPSDATKMQVNWKPGQMPKGGFRSTFDMSGSLFQSKKSSTKGGGKKVY